MKPFLNTNCPSCSMIEVGLGMMLTAAIVVLTHITRQAAHKESFLFIVIVVMLVLSYLYMLLPLVT